MAYKEKTEVAVSVKKMYSESDFQNYRNEIERLTTEARTMKLHPDLLYQRNKGIIFLNQHSKKDGTKFYEPVVKVVLDSNNVEVDSKFDEHSNFLREYDKWRSRKSFGIPFDISKCSFKSIKPLEDDFGEILKDM